MQPLLRLVPRRRCSVIVRLYWFWDVCVLARCPILDRMMQRVGESLLVFHVACLFLESFAGSLRALTPQHTPRICRRRGKTDVATGINPPCV